MSKLVIVPTPIGNLGDISSRALEALTQCDIVLCEDTRVCSKLMQHFGINKKMIVYRDDNEQKQAEKIINLIESGNVVCLTSDAGTPLISDPGYRIVNACRSSGIKVEPVPGACAAIVAMSASGLPSNGFLFLGFLPSKSSARVNALKKYAEFEYSVVFYESCYRIQKFLEDICSVLGSDRTICVAKEITKLHEKFFIGESGKVLDDVAASAQKGEYVVIIAPKNFKF